jgi:hypothetical protein
MPWQAGGASHYPGLPQHIVEELEGYKNTSSQRFDATDPIYFTPRRGKAVGSTVESHIKVQSGWTQDPSRYFHRVVRHFCMVDSKMNDNTVKRGEWPRLCPNSLNLPCPICERAQRAKAAGDQDMAKKLSAKERFYVNVFDGDDPASHWTPGAARPRTKVWGLSSTLFDKLTKIVGSRGAIWDPQGGKYLTVHATTTGDQARDVKYDMLDMDGLAVLPAGFEAIEQTDLSTLDSLKSYAELAAEILATYPDAPAGQRAAPSGAAPPFGNPYPGQQAVLPPTQWSPPPAVAAAPAPMPAPMPTSQLSPDGRYQLVNNQWVPVQAAPPPPPPPPPSPGGAPQMAPPPTAPPPMVPPQLSPDGKWVFANNQWVPYDSGAPPF